MVRGHGSDASRSSCCLSATTIIAPPPQTLLRHESPDGSPTIVLRGTFVYPPGEELLAARGAAFQSPCHLVREPEVQYRMPMWRARQLLDLNLVQQWKGRRFSVLADTSISVTFDERGDLGGLAGCNSYWGAYATDGDTLSISSLDSTNPSCTEPAGIMEQEEAYLSALRDAATFRIGGTGST